MKFREYQSLCRRTMTPDSHPAKDPHYLLGLFGELGELTELIKSVHYSGHKIDGPARHSPQMTVRECIAEEIGDSSWYVCAMANELDVDLWLHLTELKGETEDPLWLIRQLFALASGLDRTLTPPDLWRAGHYLVGLIDKLRRISRSFDLCYDDVLQLNEDKRRQRYPDGFTVGASLARSS